MSLSCTQPRADSSYSPSDVDDLARLLPLWPHELADQSLSGHARRCRMLQRALRQERQRGIAGHWTYDLGRHAALRRHYEREVAALKSLNRSASERSAAPRSTTTRRDLERV